MQSKPVTSADELNDPILVGLFSYWQGLPRTGSIPLYASVDVVDIPPHLLPNIFLVEVENNPRNYRYKLTGTEIDRRNGFAVTGMRLSEVPIDHTDKLAAEFDRIVETGEPRFSSGAFITSDELFRDVERVVVPLSHDGETVDMLLGIVIFYPCRPGTTSRMDANNAPNTTD